MLEKIFEPIKIGKLELKNRLVVPPMGMNYCNAEGTATERFIAYYEARAKGGWGLIITECYAVDQHGKPVKNMSGFWSDDQIESHAKLAERVHKHGGKIAVQLFHAGRQTGSHITGVQPIAPSPIKDPTLSETPHELTKAEIKELVEKFGDAALRVKKAGFDAVEIHGAHGYLIDQFLSPFSNKRTDEYGGTIINRTRFAVEIIENVRKKVGKDFPVLFRISTDEFVEGGLTIEDTKVIAKILEQSGIDAIHCSTGVYKTMQYVIPPAAVPHAFSVSLAAEIKKVVSIPVIAVGRINDPLIAESVLLSQKADLISMGRASLADPELPNKAKEGRLDDIIQCIGCVQGCAGRLFKGLDVRCLVNPLTGKENEFAVEPAKEKKKVFVAGGGIAGMESAIIAAKRGHEVHLYEKDDKLGGQWLLAAVPPSKAELNTFTIWQKNQMDKLGVHVHLNSELNEDIVENEKPDAVIIATGAKPIVPNIPGVNLPEVVLAQDVLAGKKDVGQSVVVVGGGLVGAETAAHLANHGKKVVIIEMLDDIVIDGEPTVKHFLLKDLQEHHVEIITSATVKEIKQGSVTIEKDHVIKEIGDVDNVVIAVGSKSENALSDKLQGKVEKIITVGDAIKVRKALEAVEEGYKAGLAV
ncbi:FAD-dependent oxidoreductase [Bacillus methanolicus]|uniref:NADH oxidase n=1 Tax=Bacillus methanolicus (strain MGA3 / ATCC 53907) TaxID=796606 RepID=I3DZS1_BACMM|nr:FAD-dependent oxidoreductase [Bacillus methanolicus]AIE59802.1 NADH oxidase [Bacillus methanolicus MGA3]EIJ79742.1 NADH:flavin oxidoreductase [Bacillus methanolicus MGA3]